MDLRDCQDLARAVAEKYRDDGDPFRGLARLLEEAGEVAAEIARLEQTGSKGFYLQKGDHERLEDELADVLINLAGLANTYGLDLGVAMERKRGRFVSEHDLKPHHGPLAPQLRAREASTGARIAVYASSSDALSPEYYEAGRIVGRAMGERGYTMVYGGGSLGIMRAVSHAVREHGGSVHGVILAAMVATGGSCEHVDRLDTVTTMRSRKRTMDEASDAFVAMPGGFGTFEEILEILSLKQLGYHDRPVVLLNQDAYYRPLIDLFDQAETRGFALPRPDLYLVADRAEDVVPLIDEALGLAASEESRSCAL
jgi:hypothetical protein